jgi:hypothetical protein
MIDIGLPSGSSRKRWLRRLAIVSPPTLAFSNMKA